MRDTYLVLELADGPGRRVVELREVLSETQTSVSTSTYPNPTANYSLHGSDHGRRACKRIRLSTPKEQTLRAKRHARTAHQNLDVRVRRGQGLLDLLLGHEANTAIPIGRRVVEHVVDAEAVAVLVRELVQLLLEKDVLGVDVGVDERELRAVEWVLERRADDLQHGRDARPARNHAELARERRAVLELALWALDAHLVADLEEGDVPRDVTLLVRLVHVAPHGDTDTRFQYMCIWGWAEGKRAGTANPPSLGGQSVRGRRRCLLACSYA